MKVYDLTLPIFEGMTVYKNKPEKQPRFETVQNNYVSETRISLDAHTGTHIDAPLHMIINGKTSETIDLTHLVGPCKVIDMTQRTDGVSKKDFDHVNIKENDFLLLKTLNSYEETFNPEFIYVKEDAADLLAAKRIRGVGIDALGIERSQPGHPTHKTLFNAGIIVIEGLNLKDIAAGEYFMVAAPLKLVGIDASPARVLLIEGVTVTR
ncbi:MAG TPA: cyclase family protein [Bacillota bacterium]|nr:cyclase family protein [Bacillota bacterium]